MAVFARSEANGLGGIRASEISVLCGRSLSKNPAIRSLICALLHSVPEKLTRLPYQGTNDMCHRIWSESTRMATVRSQRRENAASIWLKEIQETMALKPPSKSESSISNCSKEKRNDFENYYEISCLCKEVQIQVLVIHCKCIVSSKTYGQIRHIWLGPEAASEFCSLLCTEVGGYQPIALNKRFLQDVPQDMVSHRDGMVWKDSVSSRNDTRDDISSFTGNTNSSALDLGNYFG